MYILAKKSMEYKIKEEISDCQVEISTKTELKIEQKLCFEKREGEEKNWIEHQL